MTFALKAVITFSLLIIQVRGRHDYLHTLHSWTQIQYLAHRNTQLNRRKRKRWTKLLFAKPPSAMHFLKNCHYIVLRYPEYLYFLLLKRQRWQTLLSISLLPRADWITYSNASVRPSHSLILLRASSPAELTFLQGNSKGHHLHSFHAHCPSSNIFAINIQIKHLFLLLSSVQSCE